MSDKNKYWFPAKRYGWGWGLPSSWEGWTVLVVFFSIVTLGAIFIPPISAPMSYTMYVAFACLILVAICWLKGEPTRWRWGK